MNRLVKISSCLIITTFLLYVICFVGILANGPLYVWSDASGLIEYSLNYPSYFQEIAYIAMLVMGLSYVVWVHALTEGLNHFQSRLSRAFSFGFFMMIGINYFLQLAVLPAYIANENLVAITIVAMANPLSLSSGLNMFGWTFLFPLSCLFLFLALDPVKMRNLRRWLLVATLIMGMGFVAYLFQIIPILFLVMYPGLGGVVLGMSISVLRLK